MVLYMHDSALRKHRAQRTRDCGVVWVFLKFCCKKTILIKEHMLLIFGLGKTQIRVQGQEKAVKA